MSARVGAAAPLYLQIMGARAFAALPEAVRRLHQHEGHATYTGTVDVAAPATWPGKVLARLLGAPHVAAHGPIRFELEATAAGERWIRHFPGRTMTSTLTRHDNQIVERLGVATLYFTLEGDPSGLRMQLQRMYFCGVRCPRFLLPRIVAAESQHGSVFCFTIRADVPLAGRVVGYSGHLIPACGGQS